jgi:hypothetical protein
MTNVPIGMSTGPCRSAVYTYQELPLASIQVAQDLSCAIAKHQCTQSSQDVSWSVGSSGMNLSIVYESQQAYLLRLDGNGNDARHTFLQGCWIYWSGLIARLEHVAGELRMPAAAAVEIITVTLLGICSSRDIGLERYSAVFSN